MTTKVPHLRVVVSVSAFVMLVFAAVTFYVLTMSDDLVTKGNVIGTWQNFALLAVGFWLGSSSGGKARDPETPTGKKGDPVAVEEVSP